MLRPTILNTLNQSYPDFTYAIGLKLDNIHDNFNHKLLIDDIVDARIVYSEGINNKHCLSHFNNMNTIKTVENYEGYDVFIKMDDDDIYKKDYVKNIVEFFEANKDVDIVSSKIRAQLNNYTTTVHIAEGFEGLGKVYETDDYKMPMTYAFNNKALKAIIDLTIEEAEGCFDDMIWRLKWRENNLKHAEVDNKDNIIWNIHGGNASTGNFFKPE